MDNSHKSSTNGTAADSQFTEEDVAAFLASPLPEQNQVEVISGEGTSRIQQQNVEALYDPFINQLLNDPPLFQGLGISNDYQATHQALERARMDIEKGLLPNIQMIMTAEKSASVQNACAINSEEAWNSRYVQFQSQFAVPRVAVPNGYFHWEPIEADKVYRPEQPMAIQTNQKAPAAQQANPDLMLNIGNQNATPMVSSAAKSKAVIPQQTQTDPNLQARREQEARNFMRLKDQGRSWTGRRLEAGESSGSKRQRINSSPMEGPNTGLALQQPNQVPENHQVVQNLINLPASHVNMMSSFSVYDPIYEALGLAVDPHIRLYEAQYGRIERGYHMFK